MKKEDEDEEVKLQPSYPLRNLTFNKIKKNILSLGKSRVFFQDQIKKLDLLKFYSRKKNTKFRSEAPVWENPKSMIRFYKISFILNFLSSGIIAGYYLFIILYLITNSPNITSNSMKVENNQTNRNVAPSSNSFHKIQTYEKAKERYLLQISKNKHSKLLDIPMKNLSDIKETIIPWKKSILINVKNPNISTIINLKVLNDSKFNTNNRRNLNKTITNNSTNDNYIFESLFRKYIDINFNQRKKINKLNFTMINSIENVVTESLLKIKRVSKYENPSFKNSNSVSNNQYFNQNLTNIFRDLEIQLISNGSGCNSTINIESNNYHDEKNLTLKSCLIDFLNFEGCGRKIIKDYLLIIIGIIQFINTVYNYIMSKVRYLSDDEWSIVYLIGFLIVAILVLIIIFQYKEIFYQRKILFDHEKILETKECIDQRKSKFKLTNVCDKANPNISDWINEYPGKTLKLKTNCFIYYDKIFVLYTTNTILLTGLCLIQGSMVIFKFYLYFIKSHLDEETSAIMKDNRVVVQTF